MTPPTRATTIQPGKIELTQNNPSSPAEGEATIRIERVGICGSDLHIFSGHHPTATFPRVQGHEGSGTVETFPPGYSGPLTTGQRVAIDPILSCGSCYACRIGRGNACPRVTVIGAHIDGFLQTSLNVPLSSMYPADSLSADEAALVEPVSVGLQAVIRGEVQPGEQVLIIGAGPIGLCTAIAAIDAGAAVMVVDTVPSRLDVARAIGATRTELAGDSVVPSVMEWTGGEGPPITIDAVGAPAVIRQCFDLASPAGRVVIVGLSDQEVSLPVARFSSKELTVLGSRASSKRFPEAIALIERQRSRVSRLISHHYPLADVQQAIEFAITNPAETMKILIDLDQ